MSIILSASNLTKIFRHEDQDIMAINNVSLTFEEGTFTAIIGRSGSGKTTLLHLLSSLTSPSSGEVFLYGKKIASLNDAELSALRRTHIGFVFQKYMLLNEFTIYENIMLPCIIDKHTIDKAYIDDLLHTLGLWEQRNFYPKQLSGGQIQRASIARSLATKPTIIFADEPTGQLDRKSALEVLDLLLLSGRKYNMTIVLVTHDLKLAQMADRIVYISNGQLRKEWDD
ncbi:MAG: ABC transporter ATP-binding protein [bacterium]|nr:ABC transporter ATP-binding protein [bacterium]